MKEKTLSMAILSIVLISAMFSAMVNVESPDEITYVDIGVEEAVQLLIRSQDVTILDVRTRAEYESGYIAGAESIPLSELEGRIDELDRDGAIIVNCKSGVRSRNASNIFVNHGFENVYNLLGGINAWVDAGFSVMSDTLSLLSPDVCCECIREHKRVWAKATTMGSCGLECEYKSAVWTGEYYELRSGATCGADCSNADSTCGANPNKGYVWGIGKRCADHWFWDSLVTCAQTSTSGSTAFTCEQSEEKCGRTIECLPRRNKPGPPVPGSACQGCAGGGSPPGSSCRDATCCLGVDPDCCSKCVDKDSDPKNCGSCNIKCDDDDCCTDDKCEGGVCQNKDRTPEVCAGVTCPVGEHCECQCGSHVCVQDLPEFPLGVEAAAAISLMVLVVYMLWRNKQKKINRTKSRRYE